mgnify:CR=1 FL=1
MRCQAVRAASATSAPAARDLARQLSPPLRVLHLLLQLHSYGQRGEEVPAHPQLYQYHGLILHGMSREVDVHQSGLISVESDLIATEPLAFPSKSSRNKNDSDPCAAMPVLLYLLVSL